MGNWVPDMWQRKVAHFTGDAHPEPTTFLELATHIRAHHPELLGDDADHKFDYSLEDADHMDERGERGERGYIEHLINVYKRVSHPDGVEAGDHPHTHGELDVAIPDTIGTITSSVSSKKYASEICGCGNPATGYNLEGHLSCKEHGGILRQPPYGEGQVLFDADDRSKTDPREWWGTRQEIDNIPSFTDEEWKAKGITFNGIPHAGSRINWKQHYAHPVLESMEEQILMEITELKDMVSQLLGTGESLSTILRHDRGHDDWHRSMGQEPCTSESDCASKAQMHNSLEHRASAPEPSIHDTLRDLQGVEHQYITMSRQLRAQGLDTEADEHAEHARSARMGLDALTRMIEQQ